MFIMFIPLVFLLVAGDEKNFELTLLKVSVSVKVLKGAHHQLAGRAPVCGEEQANVFCSFEYFSINFVKK